MEGGLGCFALQECKQIINDNNNCLNICTWEHGDDDAEACFSSSLPSDCLWWMRKNLEGKKTAIMNQNLLQQISRVISVCLKMALIMWKWQQLIAYSYIS